MKKALLLMMVLLVMGSMNVCGVNLNVPSTYATVGAAIAAANPSGGDVVLIAAGTLIEPGQIVIDKNLTIQGAGSTLTTLNPGFSTSVGGNLPSESFIYIPAGITATIKDLNIDCNGKIVSHAIQSRGSLVVDGCIIQNVISGQHTGRGIVFFSGTAGNLVNNVSFNNIGRIGIHVRGNVIIPNPVVTIQNITYTGKGVGDYLDYAVEFGGGGSGTVDNLNASNCLGVATSVDNSTSAGVLVTDYWGTGTQATITHSIFTNNTDAIHVGYGAGDLSTVVAHFNTFNGSGPSNGIEAVGLTSVNAIGNYWGSYPFVSGNVSFSPWYNTPAMTTQTYLTGTGTTIQAAIDAANSGDVILLTDEVHTEPAQIVVNKNITLSGISNVTTIIKPGVNTGSSGDNRGFILVQTGKTFNMDHIRIDGSGKLVNIGILSRGPGLIDHCAFSHIGYNPGGPDYAGRGVAFYDVNMIISNCSFDNIGRIGMYMYGAGVTSGQILNNTYTGKGSGNWLDYAVEIEGGAHGIITGNTISNCLGVAYDGSTSAGLLATTYFAPGTSADITDNIFNNNTTAIVAGYNSSDGTVLEVHHNTFTGVSPDNGISAVGLAQVDATGNYWGSILPNFIQRVYGDVDFSPYCNSDFSNCNLTVAEGPVTYAGKVITIPGQTQVTIPIKVTNFNDVDAISLRILYPSANLDFVSATSNGAFPGMAITSTGDTTVHIAWAGNNSAVTLPDNSVLCTLVFNVTGSGAFALNFDNRLQTNCEYQNHTTQMPYYDMPFADFYKSGYVKTGGAVAFTRQYPGIPAGNTDQKITAVPSGGTAPYTLFEWTGPLYTATGATIVPGGYGNYTVTITDTDGAVMSSTYHYNRVHNTISMLDYATIQGAIDAATTVDGNVITADGGAVYNEQVLVNKQLTLKNMTSAKPVVNFNGTATGKPALFDISEPNVTIDGFNFEVDLSKISSGIVASAGDLNNITIQNCQFNPYKSGADYIQGYSYRNAISINYGSYRMNSVYPNLNINHNLILYNEASTIGFRGGIVTDEGMGFFNNNTIQTISQDIEARFGGSGNIDILSNTIKGGGVNVAEFNFNQGFVNIRNNTFDGTFGSTYTSSLRLLNNIYKSVTVADNIFSGHEWGVSMENFNNVTVIDNVFTPKANSTTYHHITINTKVISNNSATTPHQPVDATILRNTFNWSGSVGGYAISFFNHDINGSVLSPGYMGMANFENIFNTGIGTFIYLDQQTGLSSGSTFPPYSLMISGANSVTTMAPWNYDLNFIHNKFDVGSGPELPANMSDAELFLLEDKIVHKIDYQDIGFVTVKSNNAYVTPNSFIAPLTTTPSIQRGIAAAGATGWTVNIADGNYFESNISVNKAVTVRGETRNGVVLGPSMVDGHENNSFGNASNAFILRSGNIRIENLTIDGDSDNGLPGEMNFRNAAVVDYNMDNFNNIRIENLSMKNLYRRGIALYSKDNHVTGMNVINNSFENIGNNLPFEAGAAVMVFDADASVSGNTITNCGNGIGTNYLTGEANAGVVNISGNSISVDAVNGIGLDISGLKGGSVVNGNTITQGYYGIVPEYTIADETNPVVVSNNTISGVHYGIYLYALENSLRVNGNEIHSPNVPSGSKGILFANEFSTETNHPPCRAVLDGNIIHGFETGIDLPYNGMTGEILNNNVYSNGIGLNLAQGATLVNCKNNFFVDNTICGIKINLPFTGTLSDITSNDLSGNPAGNAIHNASSQAVAANCNWWGSSSAATVFDQKTGPVYFAPWLTDGTDNDLLAAGFQPANGTCSGMPVHNLTKDTYHLTIQDAVNVADPANVIECAEYTYREKVQIDKSISLHGVDSVNCIIDGTGLGAGYGITLASGVTNTSISFFTIRNHNGGITALGGNNFLTIQYCTLQNNVGAHGFLCNSPVNNVVIDHVNSFGHTGGVRGIVFWGTGLRDHVSITNCHVYNNNCCGIELQDGTGTDVYLANNYVHDNGDNGIGLMGLKGPGVNIIEKNTLRNNGRFGIEIKNPNGSGLSTGNASIVVQNNNITFTPSVTMDSRDHAGIAAFRRSILTNNSEGYPNIPTGVVIQNNTVSGYTQMNPAHGESEGFGIVIEGTNNTVAGNNVSGCDVGIQQQGGGHPNANYVPDNAGDGDQNTGFSAAYFGRGNSPVACGNNISGNTLSSNTLNARNSGPYNGDGYLRNVSNGETFCTFQTAIDDVHTLAGHQINASAGTYKENVIVNKPVVLNGSGIDISIVHPAISAPMEGASGSLPAGSSNVFLVQANNVTIRNLTINGDNPSLTSGVIRRGADIDARNGIITNHNLGTFNDLNVNNTAIKNIYLRGVYASSSGSFSFGNNIIENIQGESQSIAMMNWGGTGSMTNNAVSYCNDGIVSNHSTGVTYSGNTVTHSGTGIHTDNNGDSGGTADVIHNNTVSDGTSGSYGIFVFASHLNTEVSENNVTGVMVGLCAAGQYGGIPEFSRNTVTNTTYGIFTTTSLFGWGSSSSQSSFLNNIIDNNTTAITLEAETGQSNSTLINNNHITGSTTMLTIDGGGTGSYNVNCNWWGAADASTVVATVGVPYTVADFSPWLTSGTDASGDPGFQPVPNSCNGLPALAGNINYFNTGSTPLNNVVVKLWQGNQEKYSTTSLANGSYTFAGVDAGQYNVRFAATKPTNGAVNATDAAQVNYWSANNTGIERIRFMAGDVAGAVSGSTTVGDKTVSSADASRIINYFVTMGTPAFDTNWVFWKTSDLISNNPNNAGTLAVEVTGQNLTKDFYGMARGDFNRSFEPGSAKLAADRLRLEISGSINPVPGETFELPVYASSSMDITAISMILNHPAGILEVLGVYLGSDKNQPLQFAVHGDELRIGWMSETPVMLAAGDRLVTLKLRITGTTGTPIRLSLAGDNLNELAGADYDPINADLHTHEISAPAGTPDVPGSDAMTLTNHPNPFREQTLFTYTLPASGHVTLDIYNLMGSKIITIVDTDQVSGEHSVTLKGDFAASGVYVANLKLVANGKEFNRIIKIVANR